MKLLCIVNRNPFSDLPPSLIASNNRRRGIAEGLSCQGVDVKYIVVYGTWSIREYLSHLRKHDIGGKKVVYASARLSNNIILRGIYKVFGHLIQANVYRKINSVLNDFKPDFVWSDTTDFIANVVFDLYKKRKDFSILAEFGEYTDIDVKRKKNECFFCENLGKETTLLMCVTQELCRYYKELFGDKPIYYYLPTLVDLSRFDCKFSGELPQPYIMYCGGLTNKKDGIDILIQAFARVADKISHSLYLIGEETGDYQNQIATIKKLNLQSRVFFLGKKKREEVPGLLMGASVLALARPDSHQAQGGFPSKLGEYLATGNPVCVTVTSEIGEYLEDKKNAFLAIPGNVDSFADALLCACKNKELAEIVGKKGRLVAERNFDMRLLTQKLYFELERIMCASEEDNNVLNKGHIQI